MATVRGLPMTREKNLKVADWPAVVPSLSWEDSFMFSLVV